MFRVDTQMPVAESMARCTTSTSSYTAPLWRVYTRFSLTASYRRPSSRVGGYPPGNGVPLQRDRNLEGDLCVVPNPQIQPALGHSGVYAQRRITGRLGEILDPVAMTLYEGEGVCRNIQNRRLLSWHRPPPGWTVSFPFTSAKPSR